MSLHFNQKQQKNVKDLDIMPYGQRFNEKIHLIGYKANEGWPI
jgi:hypothetical protein